MDENMKFMVVEKCSICHGKVFYDYRKDTLVKCPYCGQTLAVAQFKSELVRLQQAMRESESVKRELEQAEKEKAEARKRLNDVLSGLGGIHASQAQAEKILAKLADEYAEDQTSRNALEQIVYALQKETQDGKNVAIQVLEVLTAHNENADEKLQIMQNFCRQIVGSQNDILAKLQLQTSVVTQLQNVNMDMAVRQQLMNDFVVWSQNMQSEEIKHLDQIADASDILIEGQATINRKVDMLQDAAKETQQTLKAFHSEYTRDKLKELESLYEQAEGFQNERLFDRAEDYYRKIITKGGEDAEVYWRLILCHYCVSYQIDEFKHYIPIILNPDLTDPEEIMVRRNFKKLINDDRRTRPENRKHYETELRKIDLILDKYRMLRNNDRYAYDVFISVKQSKDGHYTTDSDVAADLYDLLTEKGLKVFNSRRTIIPAGQEYEPYIISALMSAKVLIVVGTCRENMESQWVRNEWSRYQWLQRTEKKNEGRTDRLLFCYLARGMQPDEMPKGLNPNRQAIVESVTAQEKLMAGVKHLLRKETAQGNSTVSEISSASYTASDKPDSEQQMKQMMVWLFSRHYDKVLKRYDDMMDTGTFIEEPRLHLYALCARMKVRDIYSLSRTDIDLENEPLFQLAERLCTDDKDRKQISDLKKDNRDYRQKMEDVWQAGTIAAEQKKTVSAEELFDKAIAFHKKGDVSGAAEYFLKSAQGGNSNGQNWYGWCCEKGLGVSKNEAEAIKWYRKAAEKGLANACYNLGMCYYSGKGIGKDMTEAASWFHKAAEGGDARGQYEYGLCCRYGKGIDKNEAEAAKWYKESSSQGNENAQFELGVCYEYGLGVSKNDEESVKWYRKAAEQGHVIAQLNLGLCYEYGRGIAKNAGEAVKWYRKAAEQGQARAQFRLGYCYESGLGISKNDEESVKWYRKAAEQGQATAQVNLGLCYEYGRGIAENAGEAVKWYRKAAEQGQARAQFQLGWAYRRGYGVKQDDVEAVRWYRKSADQGNDSAQNNLGFCYQKGYGVKKDLSMAEYWYRKAADQGHKMAKDNLEVLKK